MRLLLLLTIAGALCGQTRLTFKKEFKGSTPAYVLIAVERSGEATYQEAADDENPMRFRLNEQEVAEMFALAEKANRFTQPVESGLKVAFMGTKTLRYVDGKDSHEVSFNFSLDENIQRLQDWFERISESEQHLILLERAVRFDKLGVNDALLRLEVSKDKNRLVATAQFLPMLDRIVKNEAFLHMARDRAAFLAEQFRAKQSPARSNEQ